MSTQFPSKNGIKRRWHLLDADGAVLGKLASKAAMVLMTGRKEEQKVYRHFTGYPGGLVERNVSAVRAKRPARMVEDAIFGMLPKTKLGKQMYRKLKVDAGDRHRHAAQKPAPISVS